MSRLERRYTLADTRKELDPDLQPEAIAAHVAEFQAKGGTVQEIQMGQSGYVNSMKFNISSKNPKRPEGSEE